jgi:CheY-like chemotaxis protein
MRIHNEGFIQALAVSISKDPASLENWHFLHVENAQETSFDWIETILKQMKPMHKDVDCDVVHCADNDVLFISRNLHNDQFHEIASELTDAAFLQAGGQSEVVHYDLFRDWRIVRELLFAKTTEVQASVPKPKQHNFGEIASLEAMFSEAKKLRKARLPLHVMVVEDDPLTRRMVAGAFKENYALITAENAEEAIANYLLHAPDIVFLDIGLPDASGFDVLHQIMEIDPDAYVVMFSGNSYLDNVTNALSSGASGFIAKPFKKEKMRQYIHDSAVHHRKSFA